MATKDKEKVAAYLPINVHAAFKQYAKDKNLSASQAVITIFKEYFGVDYQVNLPVDYSSEVIKRIEALELEVTELKVVQSVNYLKTFNELQAQVVELQDRFIEVAGAISKIPQSIPVLADELLSEPLIDHRDESVPSKEINFPLDEDESVLKSIHSLPSLSSNENVTEFKNIKEELDSLDMEKEIETVSESINEDATESLLFKLSLPDLDTNSKFISGVALSKILGISDTTVSAWRKTGHFEEKTREKDPENRGYGYLEETKKYYQLPKGAFLKQEPINIPPAPTSHP